jgi:hypothetical protein
MKTQRVDMRPTVTSAIIKFLVMRVERGEGTIRSHELENSGRKFVERELGRSVNASTVSRKWRLLKIEDGSDESCGPFQIDEEYVIVRTSRRHGLKEPVWVIVSILGTPVRKIRNDRQKQLELNFEEKTDEED